MTQGTKVKAVRLQWTERVLYILFGAIACSGLLAYGQVAIQTNLLNRVQTLMTSIFTTNGLSGGNLLTINEGGNKTIKFYQPEAALATNVASMMSLNNSGLLTSLPGSEFGKWFANNFTQDAVSPITDPASITGVLVFGNDSGNLAVANQSDMATRLSNMSVAFSGNRNITRDPSTLMGTNCMPSGSGTVQDFLECVFFPDLGPGVAGGGAVTLAKTSSATTPVSVSRTVTRKTNPITSIVITQNSNVVSNIPTITPGSSLGTNGGTQTVTYNASVRSNATSPTTITLTATDSKNKFASASFSVGRLNYTYRGKNANTSVTDTDLAALNPTLAPWGSIGVKKISGNGYIYIAVPHSYGLSPSFVMDGLSNNNYEPTTRAVKNDKNFSESYDIFRLRDFNTAAPAVALQ